MTIIRKNSYLFFFFSLILLFSFYNVLTFSSDNRQMSHVHIEEGDTLWTMAEDFSGDVPQHQWIEEIMKENGLSTPHIVAGQMIKIPSEDTKFAPDDTIKLAGDEE